jgi:hypothetical protein
MHLSLAAKYGFRIRTRSGAVVDNLLIFGKNAPDAERKLRQIYLGCEIIAAKRLVHAPRADSAENDAVIDLVPGPGFDESE